MWIKFKTHTFSLSISYTKRQFAWATFNVHWRAEAPFLAKPYKGSDAYVTRGGMTAAMVTTFDSSKLKF